MSAGGYLTWLADALRDAGLNVVEYPGWQNRARSSGPFAAGKPYCVMWHHTASNPGSDGQADADYIAENAEDSPIANLYIDRSGTVWVLAAGATNTNGKGKSLAFSRGTVPADSMNTHALGIEVANNGVGEVWPERQINAFFTASNVVNFYCDNQPDDVATHNLYAPDRKIDPATADAVQGPWRPHSVTSSGSWSTPDVASECWNRSNGDIPEPGPDPGPPVPAPEEGEEMRLYAYLDEGGTLWVGNGMHRRNVQDEAEFNVLIVIGNAGGGPLLVNGNGNIVRGWSDVGTADGTLLSAIGKPI